MKSLYFVGNEELWNDAWFQALVESLKSRSINILLLDVAKDSHDIRDRVEKLSLYERMIFQKTLDPISFATDAGFSIPQDKLSLIYKFSDVVDINATPRHLEWGTSNEEVLTTLGFSDVSQVIEEAFIFDANLAGEVSRAIQDNSSSLVNANLLTADADELEKMLDDKMSSAQSSPQIVDAADEIAPVKIEEADTSVPFSEDSILIEVAKETPSIASEFLSESLSEEKAEEAVVANKTVLIKPVESPKTKVIAVEVAQDASAPQFSDSSKSAAPAASIEVSQLLSSMSHSVSGEDIEVLKRYASIKERELRESQAASEALRRQIKYFDDRLKKSEEERRKLLLKLEETDNELRTVADKKDENKAQLRGIESRYEEKIKELLIQLESSQFQAGKLEKKLIDFKERVRNDLQKIRSRERELASRLEIQKRDAEALLSAKDERLLNQKREMDRLEFDMDSLKERLLDDAQKNEEKRKRVARALQSLKLAQSILSGLEEDIVTKDEKDKAA